MSAASPVSIVKRHAGRHGVFFGLLLGLLLPAAAGAAAGGAGGEKAVPAVAGADPVAAALAEVERLAQAGASGLALALADARQPAFGDDPVDWLRWEERRIRLLVGAGRWRVLLQRVDAALPCLAGGRTRASPARAGP